MIYLLGYITHTSTFLALNDKGQFVGSKDVAEVIKMLPPYNYYSKDDPALIKAASQSEYSYKACIIQVGSLQIAFKALEDKHSRFVGNKTIRYATIQKEYEHLFMGVGIKATV